MPAGERSSVAVPEMLARDSRRVMFSGLMTPRM